MFNTYGPFELDDLSDKGIDLLFEKFAADDERLQNGIGIYIVATRNSKGQLIPHYVGQTSNKFGTRLVQHFEAHKFDSLFQESGHLIFFLIARMTSGHKIKYATDKIKQQKGLKSIDQLEFALIGTCLELNPDLLNKQEKRFHSSLCVPGYLNSPPSKRHAAAKALAKMLMPKS